MNVLSPKSTFKSTYRFSKLNLAVFATILASIGTYFLFFSHASSTLPADINNDGVVNVQDLSLLLSSYGSPTSACVTAPQYTCDLNGADGVTVVDLSILLSSYGQTAATDPSGQNMPEANAYPGYTQVIGDEFTNTSLDQTTWNGFYYDLNEQYGPFLSSHGSVNNGMITMSDFVDPAANGASSGTNRAGTGLSTRVGWTSGMAFVRARADAGVGVTMCLGLIGANQWPPELDFYEDGKDTSNVRHQFTVSTHYGTNNNTIAANNNSVDATQWHTYGVSWNSSTISYSVDGTVWSSIPNPDPSGANSFSQPQELFMQITTLDWGSNNVPVNSSTPATVNMNVDWAAVYTPS